MVVLVLIMGALTTAYAQVETRNIVYYCPPCGCSLDEQVFEGPGICEACDMTLRIRYTGADLESRPFVPLRVGILLFDGADIMDVTGPWSVFEHASTRVVTVAKSSDMVRLGMTMQVKPDYTLENMPEVDVLVLPGGGPAESNQDPEIVTWVADQYKQTDYLLSVCSGAFFLGKAGLLDGLEATTFAALLPRLTAEFPKAQVRNDVKFTTNGKIFTTAGLSSGIEGAFQVIAHHYGQGRAQDVANHMEFDWRPNSSYSRPQLADNFIRQLQPLANLFSREYVNSSGDAVSWQYSYELQSAIAPEQVIRVFKEALSTQKGWRLKEETTTQFMGEITRQHLGTALVSVRASAEGDTTLLSIEAKRLSNPTTATSHGKD